MRPLFPDRVDTVVYDVNGQGNCICLATGEKRPMTASGFEPDRNTLEYRCRAVAGAYACQGRDR